MKSLRILVGRELKWVQPHALKMEFQLEDAGEVVATLRFRSSFGTFATATSAEGSWTFKRVGFWQTRATIRAYGADQDVAVFRNNTWRNGGTLELGDGRRYLASNNLWMTKYEIATEDDAPLLSFRRVTGVLHLSSLVEIHPVAAALGELPWLVAFGWYLAVMSHADSDAATASSSAGA